MLKMDLRAQTEQDLFGWPIVTTEDENAVLDVLRKGTMSGVEITKAFEKEWASWMGTRFALGYCNGTASIQAALWACGVGAGDEVICPSMTYWASCTSALALGATVHFADIDPVSLCIDPKDIEHRIGPKTKAIVVVHYAGHPCDMDAIIEIARRRSLRVIEDVSHAHGSFYRNRQCGTIGDIGCMSMMGGKSFAIGEAGMMVTNNQGLYEKCIAYGHYERTGVATRWNAADAPLSDPELARFAGIPLSGAKHRMNQTCAAMGRVQLKYYPARMKEIQNAMNRFWSFLEEVPGIVPHRARYEEGSTMGGWYFPRGLYRKEQLGGLPLETFCREVASEGVKDCTPGANQPLHLHPVFHQADLFRMGQPTVLAFGQRDVRQGPGSLPVTERIQEICFSVPWFKQDLPEQIRNFAEAYRRVALRHQS